MTSLLSRLLRHPSGCVGAAIVLTYLLLAFAAWLGLTPYDPLQQFRIDRLQGPSAAHWMGTDMFGRDVLSRLMIGIGQSFLVAFSSVGIAAVIGTVLGLTAAWVGRLWDGVVMRLMDILLAFSTLR